jgi:fructose-bisphosphate aldolase class I
MSIHELEATILQLAQAGKGILAADESSGTIAKRFKDIQLESTAENRRTYRELLFTTPGISEFINGVILFEETLGQRANNGQLFADLLAEQGIVPGIKVDKGVTALPGTVNETITQGLDGLGERLATYKEMGARFAKWRGVLNIAAQTPSCLSMHANAEALARYAAICQDCGIVPIVEPELLMDGDHSIERCAEATEKTLYTVFDALLKHKVLLEGMILKPNMVLPGVDHQPQAKVNEVAQMTLKVLLRTVPAAVPGIAFLSGGQSSEDATKHLNAMNAGNKPLPWVLTFSYGRALQDHCLKAWRGQAANFQAGQQAFYKRAKLNAAASKGQYTEKMETA